MLTAHQSPKDFFSLPGGFFCLFMQALLPFAVIGSEEEIEIDGQPVRARIYPWGIAEVDNPKHSDFSRLRSALLKYAVLSPYKHFPVSG